MGDEGGQRRARSGLARPQAPAGWRRAVGGGLLAVEMAVGSHLYPGSGVGGRIPWWGRAWGRGLRGQPVTDLCVPGSIGPWVGRGECALSAWHLSF